MTNNERAGVITRLWIELIAVFMVLPLAIYYWIQYLSEYLMLIIGLAGVSCLAVLLADKQFQTFRLWHWQDYRSHLGACLKFFLPWACLLTLLVYFIKPELFLRWPMQEPSLWIATLLIYPIVSVIPQEIIFRTYFFHRYKRILPSRYARWALSTFVFGLAHLVYGNWVAMILSWSGGAIFGYRYMQTRSTPIVVVEHALWGSFVFTVGLGSYLVVTPP